MPDDDVPVEESLAQLQSTLQSYAEAEATALRVALAGVAAAMADVEQSLAELRRAADDAEQQPAAADRDDLAEVRADIAGLAGHLLEQGQRLRAIADPPG